MHNAPGTKGVSTRNASARADDRARSPGRWSRLRAVRYWPIGYATYASRVESGDQLGTFIVP